MATLQDLIDDVRTARRLPPPAARRALRVAAGLSQAALAGVLGVDRASISRYESDRRSPRGNLRNRYAEVLERLAQELAT